MDADNRNGKSISNEIDGGLVSDLTGIGKPVTAIVKAIEKAVGKLYLPHAIREEGKARAEADMYMVDVEAYRMERLAYAEVSKKKILRTEGEGLYERAGERVVKKETNRQYNLEQTISTAIGLSQNGNDELELESLPRDWITRYLDYVETVSDPEIQMIWARILARKITGQKRSVSLMTLDSLRLMEYDHAVSFDVLARCCTTFGSLIVTRDYSDFKIGLDELSALESLGFADKSTYTGYAIPVQMGLTLIAQGDKPRKIPDIPQYCLTFRGRELASVVVRNYDRAGDLLRSTPYFFLDAEMQARIVATWADYYAALGMTAAIRVTVGSYDDINRRAKLPNVITHAWDDKARGWKRHPTAKRIETKDVIKLFEIGEND